MHRFLFRRKYRHMNPHVVDLLGNLHKYFLPVLVALKHNKTAYQEQSLHLEIRYK